jgi:hypothetical protein
VISRLCIGVLLGLASCGPSAAPASPHSSAARVRVEPLATCADAQKTIAAGGCPDAVLVWGDVRVDADVHPREVEVSLGDAKPLIHGYLVCKTYMETVLRLQAKQPRFKGRQGGSADVTWHDGQLFMRRRWSAADVALGTLDPPPKDVFGPDDALAAISSCADTGAVAEQVLPAMARLPTVFVFAMLPLR